MTAPYHDTHITTRSKAVESVEKLKRVCYEVEQRQRNFTKAECVGHVL